MRYDELHLLAPEKLTNSQLNLPHNKKRVGLMNKLKIKTEMLRRNRSRYCYYSVVFIPVNKGGCLELHIWLMAYNT